MKSLRKHIVQSLWTTYRLNSTDMQQIDLALNKKHMLERPLDHFAIIDLPSPASGIPVLQNIFEILGYTTQGRDYLADKQNDFLWLAEEGSTCLPASQALPQVVVADFRLEALPNTVRTIIQKYTAHITPAPLSQIKQLCCATAEGDAEAAKFCAELIITYLHKRDWPLPTVDEYLAVKAFNELLAWVLVFGRRPNHFTLSVHLLPFFKQLSEFHLFIENEAKLQLNLEGGRIKGGPLNGIAQGSTMGMATLIDLADGKIQLPTGFVEFVWRYPLQQASKTPHLWQDYFTGFIASHADKVIESLCTN